MVTWMERHWWSAALGVIPDMFDPFVVPQGRTAVAVAERGPSLLVVKVRACRSPARARVCQQLPAADPLPRRHDGGIEVAVSHTDPTERPSDHHLEPVVR